MLLLIISLFLLKIASAQYLPDGYEEVTTKGQGDFGALEKCGEGASKDLKICVPYHRCDRDTNTVVEEPKINTDGFGIIDIRFGANECPHHLDVCCNRPNGTQGSSTVPPVPPTQPPNPPKRYCGVRNINGIDFKITGDQDREAEYAEFPWMVAILKKNYNPAVDQTLALCGGSLITPRVVLTGAHCVFKFKTGEIKVRAGEWDTQTEKERLPYQEREVTQILTHEDFNPQTLFNDFALLILDKAVKAADNIGTVCLPSQDQAIDSKACFASGWGKNVFGKEGQYQVILKKVQLPIVPREECEKALRGTRLGNHFILDKSFRCAGGEPGKDTCTGDGGSPLVCPDPQKPKRYIQAGIVAWGVGCGENIPGVYADVTKFRQWIDGKILKLGLSTEPYTVI